MDIKALQLKLDTFKKSLKKEDQKVLEEKLNNLKSVFPFNEYEYSLIFLMDKKIISHKVYDQLRQKYVSANKYLSLYGLAPRIFGEIWAHQHLMNLDNRFKKPSKKLDPNYQGQYDLFIERVKTEVKAARAINTKQRGDLVSKAVAYGSHDPFWMNFQQLKPAMADVFVFIGVWPDRIIYWVLSQDEVRTNKYLSHQHRGGIEHQIGVTEKNLTEFKPYSVTAKDIGNTVVAKSKRSKKKS